MEIKSQQQRETTTIQGVSNDFNVTISFDNVLGEKPNQVNCQCRKEVDGNNQYVNVTVYPNGNSAISMNGTVEVPLASLVVEDVKLEMIKYL